VLHQLLYLALLEGNQLHHELLLTRLELKGLLSVSGDEIVTRRLGAIEFDFDLAIMAVFNHVLYDVALALEEFDPCVFFILLVGELQILAQFVDELAMCAVVVLGADIALDQDVDFNVGVHRQSEEPFFFIVVQAVFPVDAILPPHLTECL
jgi:hypothetical protein